MRFNGTMTREEYANDLSEMSVEELQQEVALLTNALSVNRSDIAIRESEEVRSVTEEVQLRHLRNIVATIEEQIPMVQAAIATL